MSADLPSPPPEASPPSAGVARALPRGIREQALYPNLYVWFIFLATMDLLFTTVIITLGGHEVNLIADWVIRRYSRVGIVVYKFGLVTLVIVICELVGRLNRERGERLAHWAIALTLLPVLVAAGHLVQVILQLNGLAEPVAIDLLPE
jgi:hypothetical protein